MNILNQRFNEVKLAITLLTRIPIGSIKNEVPSIAASGWVWPIIGMLIGCASGLIFILANYIGLPSMACALLSISASILITGGLHEDGLADLCDGFGGGHTKERKLEIMRDSAVGSYGVLALIISVGLRVTILSAFSDPITVFWVLLATGAFSRATMPVALTFMPSAREDGMGHIAADQSNQTIAFIGVGIASVLLWPYGFILTFTLTVTVVLFCTLLGYLTIRQIGGQTGDVLGTMQQVAEISTLLVFVSYLA